MKNFIIKKESLFFEILGYKCYVVCETTIKQRLFKKNIKNECYLEVGCQTYTENTVKDIHSMLYNGLEIKNEEFDIDKVRIIIGIMNGLKVR